jgi:Protein of unknown function (DUF1822)
MTSLEDLISKAIPVPLSAEDRSTADGFAAQAGRFAERIRRNTLAVLAVQRYLTWQGFETDLAGADCWHPALRLVADVADLPVVGLGRLECLVLPSGVKEIEVPLEVSEDRLAYVVLELASQPLGGRLLGFLQGDVVQPEMAKSAISLERLGDMDEFIDCLYGLQSSLNASALTKFAQSLLSSCYEEGFEWVQIGQIIHAIEKSLNMGKEVIMTELIQLLYPSSIKVATRGAASSNSINDELSEVDADFIEVLAKKIHSFHESRDKA